MKRCYKCERTLPLDSFSASKNRKDGKDSKCKECVAQYARDNRERRKERKAQWHQKNKEEQNRKARQYLKDNKESIRSYQTKWKRESPWHKTLHRNTKKSAKNRGLEHTLTPEYILSILPEDWKCPILGMELKETPGGPRQNDTPTIDRIDSSKGYVPGNVMVMSLLANRMKNNATPEQLYAFGKYMVENHKPDLL